MKSMIVLKYLVIAILLFNFTSCKKGATGSEEEISETLEPVENVSIISGGENVTVTVNLDQNKQSYFSLEFSNIKPNNIIENGIREGWCLDVRAPLDHNNGTYEGIKLYTTYLVEEWKPINYLLNMKEELYKNDPDITWREIQLAIWSLREHPEFDLDKVALEDLPRAMRSDGEPNFSSEKVKEVIALAEERYKNFEFSEGTKYVVIAETPADVQTLMTVVE